MIFRGSVFIFAPLAFLASIVLGIPSANAESINLTSFPYERTFSLVPNALDTYVMTLAKGEGVLVRVNVNSGLSEDCENNFVKIEPINEKGEVLIDKDTYIDDVNRSGQGNYMGSGIFAERAGVHSFRITREIVSSSECTTTDFPATISITKHTGNVVATETATGVTGLVRKTLGFMQSHEYTFKGVPGKNFSAKLRSDSGRDGFCNGYLRMKLTRKGGFNSIADTVDYSIAPIGNSSSPLSLSAMIKNSGSYKLRIERQFSKFDGVECDDSAYNYQLRLRVPKKDRR